MSEVKIKELDKSLIHQANSNSMSGQRGDISAHEYEVYCQKVMSWNIPDSRKQKIVDQIYAKWSEQLRHEAAHVSVAVAGPARYNGDSAPEAEKSVTSEPKQAASVVSTADKKAPPQEAGKLAYARRRKGAHAPALPEMQERVCTVLARTANDQRVPEVRRENPAGRAGTVRVHLPGLQEGELRSDERRGRRNRKREVLLRLRPEHPEAHVEPGQALLYDVRRAG